VRELPEDPDIVEERHSVVFKLDRGRRHPDVCAADRFTAGGAG
jgi:hypothetical protein